MLSYSVSFHHATILALLRKLIPCLVAKFKIPKKFPAPAWRFKSRRNKKHIAQFACKSRDESNEPN